MPFQWSTRTRRPGASADTASAGSSASVGSAAARRSSAAVVDALRRRRRRRRATLLREARVLLSHRTFEIFARDFLRLRELALIRRLRVDQRARAILLGGAPAPGRFSAACASYQAAACADCALRRAPAARSSPSNF